MSKPHNRTAFAMQALGLAETFNLMLGAERVRGAVSYRVELSAPDGPSTGGGKQSTQHVKLVPESEGEAAAPAGIIVAGSANQVEEWAELRTFEQLKTLHAQRFKGADIPLNRVQYNELVEKLRAFFAERGFKVRQAPVATANATPAVRTASGTLVLVAILALATLSAAVVVWFFKHR
jgi:hypothetical protein